MKKRRSGCSLAAGRAGHADVADRRARRPAPRLGVPADRSASPTRISPGHRAPRRSANADCRWRARRAGHAHHAVAPLLRRARVAQPLVAHGHAARVADLAVDDDGAAVVALVEARELAEAQRPEDARPCRPPPSAPRCPRPGARIPPRPSSSTRTSTPARARSVRAANTWSLHLARLPDVGEPVDAALRGADVGQQGGEELVAVVQQPGACRPSPGPPLTSPAAALRKSG